MKKVLLMLIIAAIVGVVVSRSRSEGTPDADSSTGEKTAQPASAAPGQQASAETDRSERSLRVPLTITTREEDTTETDPEPPEPEPVEEPEEAPQQEPDPLPETESQQVVTVAQAELRETQDAPDAPSSDVQDVLKKARAMVEAGKLNEARKLLSRAYVQAEGREADRLRDVLDPICQELIFNPRNVQIAEVHEVQPGQYLSTIARKYDVNWRLIARLNDMDEADVRRMRPGRELKVITGEPSILVWKSEFRLALFLDGVYVKEYPIGTGKNNKTPTGLFVVNNRMIRAPWTAPDGKVYHYGDEGYQLGERWIAFKDQPGASGIGIHGTHDESSIGTMCSNGCLRMKNDDVVELYDFVRNGTKVKIME